MRTATSLFITLFLTIQLATAAKTDPEKSNEVSSTEVAQKLFKVFNSYKAKDVEACKAIMSQLSFALTKEMVKSTSRSSTIDSLVFENADLMRWAYYKSVDLDYIRDVEAVIVLKHDNSAAIVDQLKALLRRSGAEVSSEENQGQYTVRLIDSEGAEVIDDRFMQNSVSVVSSLYQYEISSDGEYVIIDLKEAVPKTVIETKYLAQEQMDIR